MQPRQGRLDVSLRWKPQEEIDHRGLDRGIADSATMDMGGTVRRFVAHGDHAGVVNPGPTVPIHRGLASLSRRETIPGQSAQAPKGEME